MNQNPKIIELEAIVEKLPVEHEQDLLLLMPMGARLEALNHPRLASRWQQEAKRLEIGGETLAKLLHDRCSEGIWDLNHTDGEMLGVAVLDAQDFALFARGPQGRIVLDSNAPAAVALTRHFDAWFDRAQQTPLDDEAIDWIQRYVEVFPIPDDRKLLSVAYPLPNWAKQLMPAKPRQVIETQWPSRSLPAELVEDHGDYAWAAADAGVARYFQESLRRMNEEFVLPDGTRLVVTRQILPNWDMVVVVEGEARVHSVRFGFDIGVPDDPVEPSHWMIHVTPRLNKSDQDELLKLPLVIQLSGGLVLRIGGDD
jgi:hypothetical protein